MQHKFHFLKINQLIVIRDPSVVRISVSSHLNYLILLIFLIRFFKSGLGGSGPPDPSPGSATEGTCCRSMLQ